MSRRNGGWSRTYQSLVVNLKSGTGKPSMRDYSFSHLVHTGQNGSNRQIEILPQVGEIWCIYKNWTPPSVDTCEFVIGEIVGRTEESIKISPLTQLNGFRAVFMPDKQNEVVEIPTRDRLRFSHRIPSFLLTEERGGRLRGFYELDPASVSDVFLYRNTVMGWITYQRYRRGMRGVPGTKAAVAADALVSTSARASATHPPLL